MHSDPQQMAELAAMNELNSRGVVPYLMELAAAHIFAFDAQTLRLIYVNKTGRDYLHCDMRSIRRARLWEVFPQIDEPRARRVAKAAIRRNRPLTLDFSAAADEDGRRYVASVLLHQSDKSTLSVLLRDVTPIAQARSAAEDANSLLHTAIEALPDGFVLYDKDDRLVLCNQTYRDIYQISAPSMIPGNRFEDILRYGVERGQYADAVGREDAWLDERLTMHRATHFEVEQQLADGRWLRILERPTPHGGRVGLRIDITALKDQQAILERQARSDELTGLRNRRELAEDVAALAHSLAQTERLAIFFIDLDRFKTVNDAYGPSAADTVLQNCAAVLSTTSTSPHIAARVGGDEFMLAFVTSQQDDAVKNIAQTLRDRIAKPMIFGKSTCQITATVGVAYLTPSNADMAADALIDANIALRNAKRDPKRSVTQFEPAMRTQNTRDVRLVQDMKEGLRRGEFRPHFQPQINARDGTIIGFESLIRWERSMGSPVAAGEFLQLAQEAGMTAELDQIVMQHACAAVRILQDWGLDHPCISLNVSMPQIKDSRLVDQLTACVADHNIKPRNLRLELLESTLLDESNDAIVANVHRLIEAGFCVELDDFGTGHAAVATLCRFSVSRIKIDRSLIRSIDSDRELQTITRAIVDLAHNLNISVLAEGVETRAEQDALLQYQCDAAQGYLHARPMPLEDLQKFLQDRGDIPVLH